MPRHQITQSHDSQTVLLVKFCDLASWWQENKVFKSVLENNWLAEPKAQKSNLHLDKVTITAFANKLIRIKNRIRKSDFA